MNTKVVRTSLETWRKLRFIACQQDSKMKYVLDEIMNGKINPVEIEMKK